MNERRNESRRTDDRLKHMGQHAQQLRLAKLALGAVVLWALIASVTTILLWIQTSHDQSALDRANAAVSAADLAVQRSDVALAALQAAQDRQHLQLEQGCERLNVLRANTNATSALTFVLFRSVQGLTGQSDGSHKKHAHESSQDRLFARSLRASVNSIAWTPLNDCLAAVTIHGFAYNAPLPIRFVVQRAPASALNPMNAAKLQPVGGVL